MTEGSERDVTTESLRGLVFERLARIPWLRPLLEHLTDADMKVWFSPRYENNHYCVWHSKANYLVVVKQTTSGWLLKTAYTPDHVRIIKLHQEYANAKRNR